MESIQKRKKKPIRIHFFLPKARGNRKKLHKEHQAFLTDLLDENPSINIEQALQQLTTKFDYLKAEGNQQFMSLLKMIWDSPLL
ncbi:uncharacterized protein BX663DRAFT_513461 [Cokeromyces recurvatus]|uniref:uncharacterized protein n=1 Tax=Cokeromyces recurvatus TaxID=90255 RepID=UPI0022200685|nr:uncharacterized protein BX663DRAFT_513461 [Cokeromyces recurvatus]KAI7901621.1 hypothetical protein BX663DRAFT_513461 [Cokeromyces recurvatus]